MGVERAAALAFVEGYGRAWEGWDVDGFVALFADDVVYVVHPTEETVVGSEELGDYVRKEHVEQGAVRVEMGEPVIDGDRVAAEFWVIGETTIAGCLVARLQEESGLCSEFREYWFDIEGRTDAYRGWGR